MRACVCPKCGANLSLEDIKRDYAFCEFCGTKIMLDDFRMTKRIIDEAQLRKAEIEQENLKLTALQTQRLEIIGRWDTEQFNEECALVQCKKNLHTCLWLCLIGFGVYALPFVAIKYSRLKNNYETKKKRRDYMRQLPLDRFFQEMENEWKKHESEEKNTSFLDKKIW
ncbi:hypothetical protein SAMN02910265_00664 [Ruminococcus flavefaciens]|uniref:Uncharacterized protein n=1 Tax=Ruminococcus flavefaciens TaxID=1265 RepID=A0A1H6I7T7_RUMFL|nr:MULTISPECIES: hypothetical protein [Ruminococcus]MCR4795619.1 hypothetical protein [Ruminococcus sp.]SEH44773.1 hypothetical protein SAMN02910265_00664 [Ruminococcus flavefaciens]